jgi:hypothetical protein
LSFESQLNSPHTTKVRFFAWTCRIRHVAPARTRSPERARDLNTCTCRPESFRKLRALCQNFSAISEIGSLKRRGDERNGARLRMPRCSRSGRLGRGRPLRICSDRLPLSDMASRACSKPVGAMYARGAGPSTPSLDQRERVGHYREQAVALPRLRSPFTPMVSESHQANHRHAPS